MAGLVALAALLLIAWLSHGAGDRFFYRPDAQSHGTPASYGLDVEEVSFAAPGGPRLHGWLARAKSKSLGTVVYAHGNHANLTHHARFVAWLPSRGYDLLLFDYRGFGKSEGTVAREGTVADTMAAIDFALARDPRPHVRLRPQPRRRGLDRRRRAQARGGARSRSSPPSPAIATQRAAPRVCSAGWLPGSSRLDSIRSIPSRLSPRAPCS
jgi:hypothetical protein